MTDEKSKRDGRDRAKVSGSEHYEVADFAQQQGLTAQQVRELVERHGNNRETLIKAAAILKGKGA